MDNELKVGEITTTITLPTEVRNLMATANRTRDEWQTFMIGSSQGGERVDIKVSSPKERKDGKGDLYLVRKTGG